MNDLETLGNNSNRYLFVCQHSNVSMDFSRFFFSLQIFVNNRMALILFGIISDVEIYMLKQCNTMKNVFFKFKIASCEAKLLQFQCSMQDLDRNNQNFNITNYVKVASYVILQSYGCCEVVSERFNVIIQFLQRVVCL